MTWAEVREGAERRSSGREGGGACREQNETGWANSWGMGVVGRRGLIQWDSGARAGCWTGEQCDEGTWKEEQSGPRD